MWIFYKSNFNKEIDHHKKAINFLLQQILKPPVIRNDDYIITKKNNTNLGNELSVDFE